MAHFKANLLVQFSVVSFVIMVILAVVISVMLSSKLDQAVELIKYNNAAMLMGIEVKPTDAISIESITREVINLRWVTYWVIGGGFVILYVGLVSIVWRGWATINRQRRQLQSVNAELATSVGDLRGSNERLHVEIAERRLLEEQLQHRNIELAAVNDELEAFSYSVSHDLRAPLRSIDGFSQALLEDYADKLDEQGKDYLGRARAASQRMGILIDDLLNLSRVTRTEIRRESVDLSALAQLVGSELQQQDPDRQVTFEVAEGAVAVGDPHLLRTVLDNLIGNAWKFTGKHPQARLEFGITEDNGQRAYFVRDDGAGFDMAHANKLFRAFQRLHEVTEFEGTGIGLATVQRIINRHGGRVWAESAIGEGATFYFTLA